VIASCLLLGEFCSFVVGNWLLTRGKLALRNSDLWIRPVVFCGIAILIATGERWLVQGLAPVLGVIISLVVTLLFFGVAAMINPSARRFLKQRGRPSR
jgi:Na+/H+-dicarboxylate symporter